MDTGCERRPFNGTQLYQAVRISRGLQYPGGRAPGAYTGGSHGGLEVASSLVTYLDLDARVFLGGGLLLRLFLAILGIICRRHRRPPLHDQFALPARHQL